MTCLLSRAINSPCSHLHECGKVDRGPVMVIFTNFTANSKPLSSLKRSIIEARLNFVFVLPTPLLAVPPPRLPMGFHRALHSAGRPHLVQAALDIRSHPRPGEGGKVPIVPHHLCPLSGPHCPYS